MKKYINEDLIKILLTILFFIISLFLQETISKIVLLVMAYIIVSYEMYIEAFENIRKGKIFDENLLMILATLGAFFLKNYKEAVLVMLLYQIGEYLSDLAVNNSKNSITNLMNLKVEKVRILDKEEILEEKIEDVIIGEILIVKPGEIIPLDGIVVYGKSTIDTFSITGESTPKKVEEKDKVLSGCINKDSILNIKTTSTYKTSTAQKIIDLIEKSEEKKSNTENFIERFASIYTPIICIIALLLVIIPTILGYNFDTWLYRSLVFLVTSCPCALVISVPLGYFCGIGKAAKEGIIVKGAKELESLTDISYVILDKTGTITEGVFEVTEISTTMKKQEFLKIVASAEANSVHLIASAIEKEYQGTKEKVTEYKEISGKGISCKINNKLVLVGNEKLMDDYNIKVEKKESFGTTIYLAIGEEYKGFLTISDKIKKTSKNIKKLESFISREIIILSGDNDSTTRSIAKTLGIKTSYGDLLPLDKVKIVKKYQKEGKVIFVGDGINDAPVLKTADSGISMGKIGSDAAIEASDVVLMDDDLSKIEKVLEIAKLTKRKVLESVIFSLVVKFIVLFLGTIGKSTVLLAVFADVGVTLLVVLNVLIIFFKK